MVFAIILGILLGAFTILFALQNTAVVTLTFFSSSFEGSLALILLAAAALGVITSLLIVLPESIASYFKYRRLQKENAALTEDLRRQKELTAFAKKNPPTLEELSKLDYGRVDPTL